MTTLAHPAASTPEVAGTFRDPAGYLLQRSGRVLRFVSDAGISCSQFLSTAKAQGWMADGSLVRTWPSEDVDPLPGTVQVLEHERIAFRSYPYEWCPEMLHAAAELTLRLGQDCLDDGYSLKDATPYNVLFRGAKPVFVDALSFEPRRPGDATWTPYAQFLRTFLLPLLVNQHFGLQPGSTLLTQRDGLEPEAVYRLCSWLQRLTPPFLSTVSLPTWMGRKEVAASAYGPKDVDPERAAFVLKGLLRGLATSLAKAAPKTVQSRWSGYLGSTALYDEAQFQIKEAFVREALDEIGPRWVLDVGCNEGHFSALAAKAKASVVAIDSDATVVGHTWRKAIAEDLDILPLVVDLGRPTPATGWRNEEAPAFLERARGRFDLVLGLAVLHHMLVTERIPLGAILDQFAEMSSKYVLLEFVSPEDPMFQRIVRGRAELYRHLNRACFEAELKSRFTVVRAVRVDGLDRWLYLLRKNDSQI